MKITCIKYMYAVSYTYLYRVYTEIICATIQIARGICMQTLLTWVYGIYIQTNQSKDTDTDV